METYPSLIEPDDLEQKLEKKDILIIDLCKPESYQQGHIPGAVHLDYAQIVMAQPPVMGLLPDAHHMSQVLSALGVEPHTQVIAYDDEGGGRACRLLWTLEAYGHTRYSLLNGGLNAWVNEGHALSTQAGTSTPSQYPVQLSADVVADHAYILSQLHNDQVVLLDTRSPKEFSGEDKRAERAGRVPGAVNLEWTLVMEPDLNLRFKSPQDLMGMLAAVGVTPDKEIITYCQTHHRSAHTWFMLRWLGFDRVKGYPGAWSDWGNRSEVPVEL